MNVCGDEGGNSAFFTMSLRRLEFFYNGFFTNGKRRILDLSFLWTVKKGRVKPLPLARILYYRTGMHGVGSFVCS